MTFVKTYAYILKRRAWTPLLELMMKWAVILLLSVNIWANAVCCCGPDNHGRQGAETGAQSMPACHAEKPSCHGSAKAEANDSGSGIRKSCNCGNHTGDATPLVIVPTTPKPPSFVITAPIPSGLFYGDTGSPLSTDGLLKRGAQGHSPPPSPIRLSRFLI